MNRYQLGRRSFLAALGGAVGATALSVPSSGRQAGGNWRSYFGDAANTGDQPGGGFPVDGISVGTKTTIGVDRQPVVVDGTVYTTVEPEVTHDDGRRLDDGGRVRAREVGASEATWERTFEEDACTAPAVADGRVVVGFWDGTIRALAAESGDTEWTVDTVLSLPLSPKVADGTVFLTGDGDDAPALVAVDVADGTERWRVSSNSISNGVPAVNDGTVYLPSFELKAIDAASGEVDWTADVEISRRPPAATADAVFVVGTDGSFTTILQAVEPSDGSVTWSVEIEGGHPTVPATDGSGVYVGTNEHTVLRYAAGSGEEEWSAETVGHPKGAISVTDGAVYVSCSQEFAYAFDPEDGTELWRARLRERANMALAEGSVFAGSPAGLTRLDPGSNTDVVLDNRGPATADWRVRTDLATDSDLVGNDESLYFTDGSNSVLGYAHDGDDEWTTDFRYRTGITTSPTVMGDRVMLGVNDGEALGLDASSGDHEWQIDLEGRPFVPPVVGGEHFVVAAGDTLQALAPGDGEIIWSEPLGDRIEYLTPAIDGTIYALVDRVVYAVSTDGAPQWSSAIGDLETVQSLGASTTGVYAGGHHGVVGLDPASGSTEWSYGLPEPVFGGLTVADGAVLGGDIGGTLFAIEEADGGERWTVSTDGDVRGTGVVVDDTYAVGNGAEQVSFVDVPSGTLIDKYDATAPVTASIIPADGRVFALDQFGTLHAVPVPSVDDMQSTPTATSTSTTAPTNTSVAGTAGTDTSTNETTSGSGPGFTTVTGLAGVLGAGAWLRPRRDD